MKVGKVLLLTLIIGLLAWGSAWGASASKQAPTPGVKFTPELGSNVDVKVTKGQSHGTPQGGYTTFAAPDVVINSPGLGMDAPEWPSWHGQQTGRLTRDGIPSDCSLAKVCPGTWTTSGLRTFDAYTFTNTGCTTACVTITIVAGDAACNIFSATYLDTYTPGAADLCPGYWADSGSSTAGGTIAYSFILPPPPIVGPAHSAIVVVHEVDPAGGCAAGYQMTVSGLPAAGADVALLSTALVSDVCLSGGPGSFNGIPEMGECVTYNLTARNTGGMTATGLTATITPDAATAAYVDLADPLCPYAGTVTFPDLACGNVSVNNAPDFSFKISPATPCGTILTFNVAFTSNEGTSTGVFTLRTGTLTPIGSNVITSENFDAAVVPAIPVGWVDSYGGAWTTDTGIANSPGAAPVSAPNLIFFNSYSLGSGTEALLYNGTPVAIPSVNGLNPVMSADVSFQLYNCTSCPFAFNDRVQVQVSTDAITWTNVGSAFLAADTNFPDLAWRLCSVDISAYIGQTIYIGLNGISDFGEDVAIDDFSVNFVDATCSQNLCCPTLVIDPPAGALLPGAVGTPYSVTFTTTGGTAPYTYTVVPDPAFAGMNLLNTNGVGVLDGTPTAGGTYTFTVTSTDASGCIVTATYTVGICDPLNPVTLTPSAVPTPNVVIAAPYTFTVTVGGGTAPYTIVVDPLSTLPAGLTYATTATTVDVTGTPTDTVPAFNLIITATDANGCIATATYTAVACAANFTFDPPTLTNPIVGSPYGPFTITVGGVPAPALPLTSFTGTWVPAPGPGLLFTPDLLTGTAIISGSATVAGTFTLQLDVVDANGCTGTITYTIVTCPQIALHPDGILPNAIVGQLYSIPLWATPQLATPDLYTYAVTAGALPPGLVLIPATATDPARIEGTPTTLSTPMTNEFSFTITATDPNGCIGSFPYIIKVYCPAITIAPNMLPNATKGIPYSIQLVANTVPPGTYTFTWASVPTPPAPGLTLDPNTGLISGTPTNSGVYTFTVTVTDTVYGCSATWVYTLTVNCNGLDLTPAVLPSGTVGVAYSQTVIADGGTAPYTFTISAGALPAGLVLNPATGEISGIPTTGGSYTFTITATDIYGCQGSIVYTIFICNVLQIAPATLPSPIVISTAYPVTTLTATGGTAPYTFAVSLGVLPPGLTLTPAGVLSGTPTAIGIYTFTVTVTDSMGCTGSIIYTIEIACPVAGVVPASGSVFNAVVGCPFSQFFTLSGLALPITWGVVDPATLPPGLMLWDYGTLTFSINGPFTAIGDYTFTLIATDVNGCSLNITYTIRVTCPNITINPANLPPASLGQPYSQTLTMSGSCGVTPTWAVDPLTPLPPGFTLDPATGDLTCAVALNPGVYYFRVTVTDEFGCSGSRIFAFTISAYDLTFLDDFGRAKVCINTTTGAFAYQVLEGTGIGIYYGMCTYIQQGDVWYFQGLASDTQWQFNADWKSGIRKATASFVYRAERVRSSLYDTDTSDNPLGCF